MSSSSSSHQRLQNPSPIPLLQPSGTTASRRLPPPCWSHEETVALIDVYREKWYSLRRGNLRAHHWQEVADSVALRCPNSPQKTPIQCRHKMEKLRQRYRSQIQRSAATPAARKLYNSSWVHFNRMDCMEKGPTALAIPGNTEEADEFQEYEEEDDVAYQKNYPKNVKNGYGLIGNGGKGYPPLSIPGRANVVMRTPLTMYSKFDGYSTPNPSNITNFRDFKNGYMGKFGMHKNGNANERVGKKGNNDPASELVGAIKALGDGFVRMESMKMDMVREVEAMQMEMEVKKTEMILESRQRILESFVNAVSERKNKKTRSMPSPAS